MADPVVPEEIELEPRTKPAHRSGGPTINELILAYWQHAEKHYRGTDRRPTQELGRNKLSGAEKGLFLHPCTSKSVPAPKIRPGIGRMRDNPLTPMGNTVRHGICPTSRVNDVTCFSIRRYDL